MRDRTSSLKSVHFFTLSTRISKCVFNSDSGSLSNTVPTMISSSRVLSLSRSYVAISRSQEVIRSVVSHWNDEKDRDGHVLLFQLSPSFEIFAVSCQEDDVKCRALADHEHHPAELGRRPIVFSQDRGVWDQSRHPSCVPGKSLGFSSKRVSTPTPVACVPRSGAPRT